MYKRQSYYYIGGTAEYTFEKDKHRLFAIGGYNQELTNSGNWDQWSMISIFAKANYTFNDRYLVEGTVRRDGSSRFGKGHKFGVFPSIGLGWNLHEENFVKNNLKFVNNFKIRGSFGTLGNENIDKLYKYQNLIDAGNGNETVSYTHLEVYKRQDISSRLFNTFLIFVFKISGLNGLVI